MEEDIEWNKHEKQDSDFPQRLAKQLISTTPFICAIMLVVSGMIQYAFRNGRVLSAPYIPSLP